MKFVKSFLVVGIACLTPLVSHAGPITETTTISTSGLDFSDFSCSIEKQGSPSPGRCGQISVNALPSFFAGIQISSPFQAALGSWDDAASNFLFEPRARTPRMRADEEREGI